ncbi:MAG: phosphoglycolate phosphatase [Methyloligellaceae bacterium]
MKNTTIIFDLDGTLVDTAPDLARTLNHILTSAGQRSLSPEKVISYVGHGARQMLERGFQAVGISLSEDELDAHMATFLDHYGANIAVESRPFPGVIDAISTLRSQGARLGVCTNKLEGLSRKLLDQLALSQHFEAIIGGDTLTVRKPDPEHLLSTIARSGGTPSRAIMIGDSETDIRTAKAANIPVIAVNFGYTIEPVESFEPDVIIGHYDDLIDHIDAMLAHMEAVPETS